MNKAFIFLYPQPEIFEYELRNEDKEFKEHYKNALNRCIDQRYRKSNFSIYYALLDDCIVSDVIVAKSTDKIIYVGMDVRTHRTKVDGKYSYPDQDFILNQMMPITMISIGGFHAYDCCSKLAQRAHERGIDTFIDEDLTQFFRMRFQHPDFKLEQYPSVNPRTQIKNPILWESFLEVREGKPWLI